MQSSLLANKKDEIIFCKKIHKRTFFEADNDCPRRGGEGLWINCHVSLAMGELVSNWLFRESK